MNVKIIALFLPLLLGACGGPPRVSDEEDKALLRAIQTPQDKAKAVEEQLKADEARKRKQIDDGGG